MPNRVPTKAKPKPKAKAAPKAKVSARTATSKPKKATAKPAARKDMYRRDGSKKSARGFLGPVKNRHSGGTMTEFATDMQYQGKSIDIPTMVPTLSKSEIEYMRGMKPGAGWNLSKSAVERSIVNKARAHAKQRLKAGKSPFYQDGEGK